MPLDIGVGIALSFLVTHVFNREVSMLVVGCGVIFALLPDIDILPFLWPTTYNHRSFFHYPLIYVPIAGVVYVLFGALFGVLFAVCVLAHFIHDTIGIGWGIAWLAPFSKRKFLFPEKGRRKVHGFFMTWLPSEEAEMAKGAHDPHWVRAFYLRPNPVAYVEYGAFLCGLALLLYYFSHHVL